MKTNGLSTLSSATRNVVIARALASLANRDTDLQARKACREVARSADRVDCLRPGQGIAVDELCDQVRAKPAKFVTPAIEVAVATSMQSQAQQPSVMLAAPQAQNQNSSTALAAPAPEMAAILASQQRQEATLTEIKKLIMMFLAMFTRMFAAKATGRDVVAAEFDGETYTALPQGRKESLSWTQVASAPQLAQMQAQQAAALPSRTFSQISLALPAPSYPALPEGNRNN